MEGCCHGELERIYDVIGQLWERDKIKVDLLICCGDFQVRRKERGKKEGSEGGREGGGREGGWEEGGREEWGEKGREGGGWEGKRV